MKWDILNNLPLIQSLTDILNCALLINQRSAITARSTRIAIPDCLSNFSFAINSSRVRLLMPVFAARSSSLDSSPGSYPTVLMGEILLLAMNYRLLRQGGTKLRPRVDVIRHESRRFFEI
jgi:hypothetical protein